MKHTENIRVIIGNDENIKDNKSWPVKIEMDTYKSRDPQCD